VFCHVASNGGRPSASGLTSSHAGDHLTPNSYSDSLQTAQSGLVQITVKVKLSLCLINSALCHEDIWGSGGIAPPFLTSALDGGEWSASRPCRFTPGERSDGLHIQSRHGPHRKRRFQQLVQCCLFTQSLPSNGCFSGSAILSDLMSQY
jgi:hypothetical protein